MPLVPGHDFCENVAEAWARADLGRKIVNSIVFAGGVAAGKVVDRRRCRPSRSSSSATAAAC